MKILIKYSFNAFILFHLGIFYIGTYFGINNRNPPCYILETLEFLWYEKDFSYSFNKSALFHVFFIVVKIM